MFFRREKPKTITFNDRLEKARQCGFTVTSAAGSHVMVSRGDCAALLQQSPDGTACFAEPPGLLIGEEIAKLVDGGFQKFFLTPSGKRKPALAFELKAVHEFEEDLREALGIQSLYNQSLGTVSTEYLYDRVQDRDKGVPKRPWE